MRVLDLFSGIGGFSLGLERAGMTTVAFCEQDKFCQRVLRKHWPRVPIYDDVRTIPRIGDIDLVCGGFPCQDISLAGKGAGLAGERSGLWREFARIIGEVRPRYVIVENVAAMLFRGMGDVLGDLAALGYDAEWHCIPAAAVGAPHIRDRVWIVAYPGSDRLQGSDCVTGPDRKTCGASQGSPLGRTIAALLAPADPNGRIESLGGTDGRVREDRFPWDRRWEIASAPFIRRGDDGFSNRMDRLRALGNAVVPAVVEVVGRAIMYQVLQPIPDSPLSYAASSMPSDHSRSAAE